MKNMFSHFRDRFNYYFEGQGVLGSFLAVIFLLLMVLAITSPIWLILLGLYIVRSFID